MFTSIVLVLYDIRKMFSQGSDIGTCQASAHISGNHSWNLINFPSAKTITTSGNFVVPTVVLSSSPKTSYFLVILGKGDL
jgi:hypothetical protein